MRDEKHNYYEWYDDKGGESQQRISWSYDVLQAEQTRFTPSSAGTIRIELSHAGKGDKFAKAANCAYVRPVALATCPPVPPAGDTTWTGHRLGRCAA